MFLPVQKINYEVKVILNNHLFKQEFSINYLGVLIDSHLNSKLSPMCHIYQKRSNVI